jgi:hypothetical protein
MDLMDLRETVSLGEERENPVRVGDEVLVAKSLNVVRDRVFVAQHEHGQTLMRFIERCDHVMPGPQKRHALHVELHDTLEFAREQSFDRYAVLTDKAVPRMRGIGKTRFQQKKQISSRNQYHLVFVW